MFSIGTSRPAHSGTAATRRSGQTAEDNAAPEGPANTNTGTGFARAKICQPPRRPRSSVALGRDEERPCHAYKVAVLASSRRTKPKTISLFSNSRGSMVSTPWRLVSKSAASFRCGAAARAWPNPSLNRSANGMSPGPGRRYAVHFRQPGPGAIPSSPG